MTEQIEKRIASLEDRVNKLEQKISSESSESVISDSKKKVSIKEFLMGKKVDDDVKRNVSNDCGRGPDSRRIGSPGDSIPDSIFWRLAIV